MNAALTKRLFFVAALFNWAVALGLFFTPGLFLSVFAVTPAPEQTLWIQQFAGLVFIFGVGYYRAAKDLQALAPMIRLAVWGKWGVVLIAMLNVVTGDISWQFLIPASADGIFAVLFAMALRSLPDARAQ